MTPQRVQQLLRQTFSDSEWESEIKDNKERARVYPTLVRDASVINISHKERAAAPAPAFSDSEVGVRK